ncbi:MAG: DUF3135 domain-containing protein [Deltaproteobacteria bacterium]|nr:DUF3135 domain-containing protein [Deltaproteobacteria bacterium]MBW2341657.1 DUF3135 domain-containing protein [Deltaproteobacteria bacterium]
MESLRWKEQKVEREKRSLERHAKLSRLFREDRLVFERERKRMIDEAINSAEDEEQKNRLRTLQEGWDKKMRGAVSGHNRFVLAQTIFWEHFNEVWHPAIRKFDLLLNSKPDDKE